VSLEDTLGALLEARVTPLRVAVERLASEVVELRRALPPQLVSVEEARKRLGVSLSTARRRVRNGEWPVRRDGRRVLVDLGALRPLSEEEVAREALRVRAVRHSGRGDDLW
jgi:excisionase family DNA binding protein